MKNILVPITIFFTTPIFAQTHEIIKHNGEKKEVNFIKIENNFVYYSLPSSTEEQKISKYAVAQLNDKSKKNSQIVSKKIHLTEKSDYKKVIILKETETIGLNKSNDLTCFLGKIKGQSKLTLLEMGEKKVERKCGTKGRSLYCNNIQ
jgi:hypothetical protein